ncbi:PREDICTED: ras association domain-containing protein 8 isoform X2 [Nicrophorus vespilloides]|uniref:Ras association domain-containing protein 8 isoform X2 n=1 Tax=Nicrophorus vespilloides TaxID=110193 RepID=A0ABM1MH99_NICVS|nr:PREDICTED: ras association domain-containing protein 8 isoform X2 [Nicrophorus vespilloides]
MELKVWVEGIQRIVCGVTEATTCQDVVFALAHATGKSGRFTLIERWRNNERQLAPTENPMKILMKWGEYSNDVQFILQWSESKSSRPKISTSQPAPQLTNITIDSPERQQKSPNYNANTVDNVGVVKGIPQVRPASLEVRDSQNSPKKGTNFDTSDIPSQRVAPPYKDPPAPPPYRDPPPPTSSSKKNILQEFTNNKVEEDSVNKFQKIEESVLYNAQYRELVSLVNYQRDKLSSQQVDLTKFDAEIVFWEGKEREKQFQLDFIAQELATMTNASRINSDQIQALGYVEEEVEIVKQQEKTLKSEITLLRSKLANCETELLQCKNKIRLVMDEVQMEQRVIARRSESRKQLERNLLVEMERLQGDIELAKQSTELHHLTAESLKKEGVFVKVAALEAAIIEKKKQVEHLVTEMKEANLQSLTIAPQEELKQVFEGPNRAGSTRKMIGSPRQLENAVPTNKNPHGVWV